MEWTMSAARHPRSPSTWRRDHDRSSDDIRTLTDICKRAHGLVEPQDIVPLNKENVPERVAAAGPVSLVFIFHHRGVNALAEDRTLTLSPRLTVVYGDNPAGKTAYIRILKSACRARGQEQNPNRGNGRGTVRMSSYPA